VLSRLIDKFKADFADLKNGAPGKRFIEHHERHRQSENPSQTKWKTVAYVVAGVILLVVGALLSLVPGIPGIVLGIPAIGLLVARLRSVAVLMDRMEVIGRRVWRKVRR
jgi:UPF0716 family protein affecting phage T7 exclusion